MDECNANGTILNKTGCILAYAGNSTDILINYFVFLINIAVAVIVVLRQRKQLRSRNKHDVANALGVFSVCSLIGVILFQIGLCLGLGCSGISIIWSALAGWLLSERRDYSENFLTADGSESSNRDDVIVLPEVIATLVLDSAVIMYYAITSEVITTVAHLCAVILGATISRSSLSLFPRIDSDTLITDPSTPLVARE
mmetsp:Transcript_5824/g.10324  ORF Transcript_5824/g.10324 Transcript_5824/m.10324 type:complete len:198 (-) Transcript_5824:1345-1938(-)